MYKCTDCGHLFESGEEKIVTEEVGEAWGSPVYEDWARCPICKGDFEEVKPCEICGTYEKATDENVCKKCKMQVSEKFTKFLQRNFSEAEREVLIAEGII